MIGFLWNVRDWLLNHGAVWCMKHCYNWSTCFYTACEQLTYEELKLMADDALRYKRENKS